MARDGIRRAERRGFAGFAQALLGSSSSPGKGFDKNVSLVSWFALSNGPRFAHTGRAFRLRMKGPTLPAAKTQQSTWVNTAQVGEKTSCLVPNVSMAT